MLPAFIPNSKQKAAFKLYQNTIASMEVKIGSPV